MGRIFILRDEIPRTYKVSVAGDHRSVYTRRGKPAAIVIGFRDEDDWFDYRLQHDEKFLRKMARARQEIPEGGT